MTKANNTGLVRLTTQRLLGCTVHGHYVYTEVAVAVKTFRGEVSRLIADQPDQPDQPQTEHFEVKPQVPLDLYTQLPNIDFKHAQT